MPEDKKPAYKDYSTGRKTPPLGNKTPPSHVIESSRPDRHDPTPPPVPGSITNEDLAVKLKTVEKKTDEFQGSTTLRLTNVEAKVNDVVSKVNSVDIKVDGVTTLLIEQAAKKETFTMDVMRMHGEVGTQEKLSEVKVKESKQLDTIKAGAERRKRITKAFTTIVGLLGSGAFLHWFLSKL